MSDTEASSVPLDRLARVYRRIQGKIQELTTAYETEVEQLKAQQETVKSELKDRLLAMGVKSANTAEGTVVLTTRTRYHAQDWEAFKQFIVENDALDLLEKRIAQTNMGTFLAQNPQRVPPGLNSNSEYVIAVRKPK